MLIKDDHQYIETKSGEVIATEMRIRALLPPHPKLVHCLQLWNVTRPPKYDSSPELALVTNASFKNLIKVHERNCANKILPQ